MHTSYLDLKILCPTPPTEVCNTIKKLARPISTKDTQTFAIAVRDPAYGVIQMLESIQITMGPIHTEAMDFLQNLENVSARATSCQDPVNEYHKAANQQVPLWKSK
jgi:hypothetical protein